jgi:predicted tellurium resistance membrane protein TerC
VLGRRRNHHAKKGGIHLQQFLLKSFHGCSFLSGFNYHSSWVVEHIGVMYVAIVVTVGIMMFAAYPISKFVNDHPTFKMLALAFLLLIGFSLVTEGFGIEIPKGYIYFAMFFSLMVDILQMKMKKPVEKKSSNI